MMFPLPLVDRWNIGLYVLGPVKHCMGCIFHTHNVYWHTQRHTRKHAGSHTSTYTHPHTQSCYRLPSADGPFLDDRNMLDNVCDINREVHVLDYLNIDWLSSSCPLKKKLHTVTSAYNLVQVISQPTRLFTNSTGIQSPTCIDHTFTSAAEMCLKAVSKSNGCSDHNSSHIKENQSSKGWT